MFSYIESANVIIVLYKQNNDMGSTVDGVMECLDVFMICFIISIISCAGRDCFGRVGSTK